ncbi:MAG: class I adenylate-forming enzyme family protein [Methylococcaceae bacterium]|jgi:long-chain acyl-CoA synthetase
MGLSIIQLFKQQVQTHPGRSAVIYNQQPMSYQDLAERVRKLCGWLADKGVTQGAHLVVALNNSMEFAVLMLAAADLGIVIAPVSTTLTAKALEVAISSTDAAYLIAAPNVVKKYLQLEPTNRVLTSTQVFAFSALAEDPQDLSQSWRTVYNTAYVLGERSGQQDLDYILTMTSGSTGQPKPIVLTQGTKIRRAFDGAVDLYGLNDSEVVLVASPMYHSLAQRLTLLPLMLGGTAVIITQFAAKAWLEAVEQHRVSFTLAVSSHLKQILAYLAHNTADLSSLQTLVSSSALLDADLKLQCIEHFQCAFHECYGASEVGIVTNLSPEDTGCFLRSVGKALPYVDLKIVDSQNNPLNTGEVGEIVCRSSTAFSRYYKRPEATQEAVIEGYFHTGDLGYLDAEGFLYLKGRQKDCIIVGGTNVYPTDIEEVIAKVAGISEVAVIGVEDSYFGEAILAVLVVNASFNLQWVKKACLTELADYQQPMAYEVVTQLPKNAMGKLMKQTLKAQFQDYDATKALRVMLNKI